MASHESLIHESATGVNFPLIFSSYWSCSALTLNSSYQYFNSQSDTHTVRSSILLTARVSNTFTGPDQILSQSVRPKIISGTNDEKEVFDPWYCLLKSYNRSSPSTPSPLEICSHFVAPDLLPNSVLCKKSTELFNKQSKCTHQKHSEFVLAICLFISQRGLQITFSKLRAAVFLYQGYRNQAE